MDFITSAVLGGILYDLLKAGSIVTTEHLRKQLSGYLFDDAIAAQVIEQIGYLPKPAKDSVETLASHLDNSPSWQALIKEIKPDTQQNIGAIADTIEGGLQAGSIGDNANITNTTVTNYAGSEPEKKP